MKRLGKNFAKRRFSKFVLICPISAEASLKCLCQANPALRRLSTEELEQELEFFKGIFYHPSRNNL